MMNTCLASPVRSACVALLAGWALLDASMSSLATRPPKTAVDVQRAVTTLPPGVQKESTEPEDDEPQDIRLKRPNIMCLIDCSGFLEFYCHDDPPIVMDSPANARARPMSFEGETRIARELVPAFAQGVVLRRVEVGWGRSVLIGDAPSPESEWLAERTETQPRARRWVVAPPNTSERVWW